MVFDIKIGLKKTLKNIAVTYGFPALLYLLNGYTQWIPANQATLVAPIIGFLCYLLKNYLKNK